MHPFDRFGSLDIEPPEGMTTPVPLDEKSGQQDVASNAQEPWRGQEIVNPKDGAVMVYVPAGEFLMGSHDVTENEKPQRRVYLDAFWMYTHPVTVAQYFEFCADTCCLKPETPNWGWKDDHPIVNVSWHDAVGYCAWAKVSLPTEAEWEKAARGTDGRKWPWGSEWDEKKCNTDECGLNTTTPVVNYPQGASPYSCMDMAGNAFEWCADWYDSNYYKTGPERNPTGPEEGQDRVLRGGCWYADHDLARCALRFRCPPVTRFNMIGFRCAKTP